ncbi:MAG TPA: AMP-binding protein [Myxococcota bacterium]|nr:AMP-binding protein [Myxococcota bacterium]HOC99333.1 AMP-binding protein [Myxococcota bacterium]HOH77997.1 AMP-binding protein [Myxococcota bacterium]
MACIPQIIRSVAKQLGPKPLHMDIMSGAETTFVDFRNQAWFMAARLVRLPPVDDDGVALIGFSGVQALVLEAACQTASLVPFSIAPSIPADEILAAVLICRCRWFILCDDPTFDAGLVRTTLEPLSHVATEIPIERLRPPPDIGEDELVAILEDPEVERRISVIGPRHAACGLAHVTPDGRTQVVAISHEGLGSLCESLRTELMADESDVWTSISGLESPFARIVCWYCCLLSGGTYTVAPLGRSPVEALFLTQPTIAVCDSVGAADIESGLISELQLLEGARGRLTRWGFHRARARTAAGTESHGMLDALADLAVDRLVRDIPGGSLRTILCDGMNDPAASRTTFQTAGIDLWEISAPASACCFLAARRPGCFREGSVGKPLPVTSLFVSPRGELMASGPAIMVSEMCLPPAECQDLDHGNLKTGLRGRVDDEGFVFIDGRL